MQTSRRQLLQAGLGGAAALAVSNLVSPLAVASPSIATDHILLVLQLSGGNDGLNTVIPYRSDEYHAARPHIGITDTSLRLGSDLAFHPALIAFKDLFDQGRLAVINGCGYPQPSRSHFRSLEIWHTADPVATTTNGWLGHYLDHHLPGAPSTMRAINVGSHLPQALAADVIQVPTVQSLEDFRIQPDANPAHPSASPLITPADLRRLQSYHPDAAYPDQALGRHLQLIARLITADLGTRIFYVQLGGFDTHANQLTQHHNQLTQLSESLAAFYKDLAAKYRAESVTTVCFSEFGRRLAQNNSNGTDHGAAGPVFVLGPKVTGGLYGAYPSLSNLDNGDLKYTTDFRRVYATLLDKWLNVDSTQVLNNRFEPLAFL